MSSCLSGSGRAYGLELEMLVKSPSLSSSTASTITSHSSSSSSPTLSESGSGANSPFTISTRKPRTPRKRPNQTYNEAAALLSTAYPRLFSPNNLALTKPCRFSKPPQSIESFFLGNSNSGGSSVPELLIPLRVVVDNPGFLLHVQPPLEPRFNQSRRLSTVVVVSDSRDEICRVVGADSPENLETESMLDGEIEEGIDSIMGMGNPNYDNYFPNGVNVRGGLCFGYPIGWRMERSAAALRHADDEGDWWRHPIVDVPTPQLYKTQTEESKKKTKKKKKKLLKNIIADDGKPPTGIQEDEKPTNVVAGSSKPIEGLRLKLNHESLLAAWSDRGSPFSEDPPGNDAKLGQVLDLLSLSGEREASVLRYKEKRRTRLFSKKIRYQVRKVNADRRPRMKGRFVRRPEDSPFS